MAITPRSIRLVPALAFLIVVTASVCGCGRPKYPVTGMVVHEDGTPYSGGGVVAMEAVIDGKSIMARGGIGKDGRFTLASQRPDDGAFTGTYRVRVLPHVVVDGPASVGIDSRFQSFETSGLTCDVGTGKNEYTITLGPKPAGR
jgi:hypothetical protein